MLLLYLAISTKLATPTLARTIRIRHCMCKPWRLVHLSQHDHLVALFSRSAIPPLFSARVRRSAFPDTRLYDEDEEEDGDGNGGVDEDYRSSLA
jgi:hypothetical protein